MFTSLYPSQHRMITPFVGMLNENVDTLAQNLKWDGYKTYYFGNTTSPSLPLSRGLGKGFNRLFDSDDPDSWIGSFNEASVTGNKFFAVFHTFAVHDPYLPEKLNFLKFNTKDVNFFFSKSDQCARTYDRLMQKYPVASSLNIGDGTCARISALIEALYKTKSPDIVDSEIYSVDHNVFLEAIGGKNLKDRREFVQALYEARIYELDLALNRFFDYLRSKGLFKNTIIIVTADHGEEFFEHGLWGHTQQLYNESIHVPLIIYVPNMKPKRVSWLSQVIDIPPTILGVLGLEKIHQAGGVDLFSNNAISRSYVYSEHSGDKKRAIISKSWKLIVNNDTNTKELFNLQDDPNETTDVIDTHPGEARNLEGTLKQNVAGRRVYEPAGNQQFPDFLDEEDRKKLLQTGYR